MTKKVTSLFILALFLVAVLSMTGYARSTADKAPAGDRVLQYDFQKLNTKASRLDVSESATGGKHMPSSSLGAYVADGGSPGYIIGRTIRDAQAVANPNRMIAWRSPDPKVHFLQTYQVCDGDIDVCGRYLHYNAFDASTGTLYGGESGLSMQEYPNLHSVLYGQIEVDENGNVIAAGHSFETQNTAALTQTEVFWNIGGGSFLGIELDSSLSLVSDSTNQDWPRIAYQNVGGTWVTHIVTQEEEWVPDGDSSLGYYVVSYWRKEGSGPTAGTFTPVIAISQILSDSYSLVASPSSNDVSIAYLTAVDPAGDYGSQVNVVTSHDGGLNWDSPIQLIPFDVNTDSWVGWLECNALYDQDGYLHVVWNASQYDAASQTSTSRDPARIFHWTNRVAGSIAGGTTSTVQVVQFGDAFGDLCGAGGWNVLDIAKPVISQCGDRLYTIWEQFGNPEKGDTNDCADPELVYATNGYNGEIYMSVSSDLDGSLWDAGRNLTNSHTPGCDTTGGNECDADNMASMSMYGMEGSLVGGNNWTSVAPAFAVRDAIDPSRPDNGLYLDVQFVNDLIPDVAPFGMINDETNMIYTNNPIKWFRLPCVDPVVAPRINVAADAISYPAFWVKTGTEKSLSVSIENVGNDTLTISSITTNLTSGPGGWLSITPTSIAAIEPASSDLITLTFNPGGFITTPANLEADIEINNNDTSKSVVTIHVSTVVADTVVAVSWDTVSTALGVALTVASDGNAGNRGAGGANLDFSNAGDCDENATVYLYDLSPVVMINQANYSWQPYYTPSTARSYNFKPVLGDLPSGEKSTNDLAEIYSSGTFVTTDSSIGMIKHWYAPAANVSYVVERIDLYSFDGGTYNDVRVGEFMDWDVPSDTLSNNRGGAVPGRFIYQQGLEYGQDNGCLNNDRRFGASGLLGYYTSSEHAADNAVNHSTLYGGHVLFKESLFAPSSDSLIPDSVWAYLGMADSYTADNDRADDQQILLSFGPQNIVPGDTLSIWVVHASVYDGDSTALDAMMSDAEAWYQANREELLNPAPTGCCGLYNAGYTGNTDCSAPYAGESRSEPDLSDITTLIARVYIAPDVPLCCEENGDIDGSGGDPDLSDITGLIRQVYINPNGEELTAPCQ